MDDRVRRLVAILRERSVRHERTVLASGRESDFYVDARTTTLWPEGAYLVADLILDRLRPEVRAVGGPVTGADPIAGAVAALSWVRGRPVQAFMVRKARKDHGTGRLVEGMPGLERAPVCVVEDTVTTGGSLLEAIRTAESSGLSVVQCIAVVDRLEGAESRLADAGFRLEALVTRTELT